MRRSSPLGRGIGRECGGTTAESRHAALQKNEKSGDFLGFVVDRAKAQTLYTALTTGRPPPLSGREGSSKKHLTVHSESGFRGRSEALCFDRDLRLSGIPGSGDRQVSGLFEN